MSLGSTSSYEGYNFSHAAVTGLVPALAAGELYQFRWAPGAGAKRCRILCVQISAAVVTAPTTAAVAAFDMTMARTWTTAGTGGTVVTPSATSNKLRTAQQPSMLQSAGGEIRVATTAALGAGTKTLDAQPVGNVVGGFGAIGTQIVFPIPLYVDWAAYGIPLVLDNQEGFVIRATSPAAGVFQAGVWVAWAEID